MRNESRWAKTCDFPLEFFGLRNLLIIHFIVNSIGLIVFSMLFATVLAKVAQPSAYVYASLYPWARPPVGSLGKLSSLLQYILPVLALFIHYAIFLWASKFLTNSLVGIDKEKLNKIGFYFLVAVVINGTLLLIGKEQKLILGVLSVLWAIIYLWTPYAVFRNRQVHSYKLTWFWAVVLCVISIQYVATFVPLITKPIQLSNDYINIPEKTLLKSGRLVDNIEYINEHKIAGLKLHDPRLNPNPNPNPNPYAYPLDTLLASGTSVLIQVPPPVVIADEVQDFINRNNAELLNQTKAGWFFYHHGYSFGPMNALSLGASPYQQTMVYGWLNTVSQGKVLELLGMSSYQGYFKLYFAEYLIYYAIFLLGIWAIFKRLGTVLFAALLVVSALFALGFELVRLAPGFNPVRHIFDVPAFYLLYCYLAQDNKRYLILSCALAIFSILWSKDFGLFLALSIGGTVFFKSVKQRPFQIIPLFFGLITAVSGMFLYFYPMPGANPTAMYMLLGIGSPAISSGGIFGLLIIVSLLTAATITLKQSETYTIFSLGLALYFVQSLTYYLWYPVSHHILGVAPVFILWIVAIFHGWVSQSKKVESMQSTVLMLVLLLIYIPASVSFYSRLHFHNKIFKNHSMYQWSFDKASFLSTMEPMLFEESANLIKQYSTNNNGIYIISKYDHILPILASKYSAMPYNELPTNLVSPREVKVASEAILRNKPDFIFVDSDIGRNLRGEIPIENDPVTVSLKLYGEARSREMVINVLNDVYTRVSAKYQRCDTGRLISVYCRKHD